MRKTKQFPVMIAARLTESEKVLIEDCAWKNRQTKSQFIRQVLTSNLKELAS